MKDNPREVLNLSGAIIGMLLVGILAFLAWALVYVQVPVENETAMNVLLGILSTQVSMVIGFHFGGSMSNKKLTEATASQAETIKTAQAALTPSVNSVPVAPGETVSVTGTDDPSTT